VTIYPIMHCTRRKLDCCMGNSSRIS